MTGEFRRLTRATSGGELPGMSSPPGSEDTPHSFLEELQRRHVVKVALAYGAVAWLVLQLAGLVLPAFGAPAWVFRILILLLVLLFPVALVLAWAFELTPEGVRRTEVARMEAGRTRTPPRVGRTLNAVITLALAAAVAVLAWRQFGPAAGADRSAADASEASAAPGSTAGSATIPARSVAVLPFVNMSGDSSEEYFSDGITEEILNALAQIPGLQVAGRTSSFAFKGKNESLIKIGRALHVANVMEGSVQRAGSEVRITAQLIDARTGYHVWSHTYTRPLKNVFAIEDEISAAIADTLKLELAEGGAVATRRASGTADVRAHDLYLLGLHYWNLRTPSALDTAIIQFHRAVAQDSSYADAWAGVAQALVTPAAWNRTRPPFRAIPLGEAAARRALALDPSSPQAHTALAYGLMTYDYDWKGSRAEFDSAMTLDPNYPTAPQWASEWYAAQGRTAEALDLARRAERLDPLSMIIGWEVGRQLVFDRKYGEARKQFEKVLAQHPGEGRAVASLARAALLQGDSAAAARYLLENLRRNPLVPDSVRRRAEDIARNQGLAAVARRFRRPSNPDSLVKRLEREARSRNLGSDVADMVADPRFDTVRNDPRYQDILRQVGLEEAGRRMLRHIEAAANPNRRGQ
jgi:TolB-like protein/Tfp pilus assembly protein PilF